MPVHSRAAVGRTAHMASTALEKAREYSSSLQKRLSTLRERGKEETRHLMQHGTALVGGFAIGAAEARYGEGAVAGMDIPVAVSAAAGVAALSGFGGADAAPYLRGAVDAGLAIWGYKEGFSTMRERMTRAGIPVPAPRS